MLSGEGNQKKNNQNKSVGLISQRNFAPNNNDDNNDFI